MWRSVRADAAERNKVLPGDERIPHPRGTITQAITIHCPRADVWPWLAQMGAGTRGGWYSYDTLDNGRRPSARRIIPELQHLEAGMIFPALPGAVDGFTLLDFEKNRSLILGWQPPGSRLLVTWAFVLEDTGQDETRLIVRARAGVDYAFHLPWALAQYIVRIEHYIMERRQLLGIAERAEQERAA